EVRRAITGWNGYGEDIDFDWRTVGEYLDRLDLRITGGLIEISVRDSDPALPVARAAEPSRVGQHGLEIVLAVAETFEARREGTGKRVTARVALADTGTAGRAAGRSPGARPATSAPGAR
ncbi:hypothetical protein ACWDPC_35935, partial [Streptomyces misionensis]